MAGNARGFDNGERVRFPKSAEIVANALRRRIILQELGDNDSLASENELQEEFQVSRPVAREAIRILESEGLIRTVRGPGGGTRVNPPSFEQLGRTMGFALQLRNATVRDVFEVRTQLEPPAAALAARNRPEEAAAILLEQIAVEEQHRNDPVKGSIAVADFHRKLLENCGNVVAGVVGASLQEIVHRHLMLAIRTTPFSKEESRKKFSAGLASHKKLVELIAAGKADAAEDHWRKHMVISSDYWTTVIGKTAIIDIFT